MALRLSHCLSSLSMIVDSILSDESTKSIASDSLTRVLNTFMYRQDIIAPVSLNWFRMQEHALIKIQAMEEPIRDNIRVTCISAKQKC